MGREDLDAICIDSTHIEGKKARVSLSAGFLKELVALRDRKVNSVNFLHVLATNFSQPKSINVRIS